MPAIRECILDVDIENQKMKIHPDGRADLERGIVYEFLYYDIISGDGHGRAEHQYHRACGE